MFSVPNFFSCSFYWIDHADHWIDQWIDHADHCHDQWIDHADHCHDPKPVDGDFYLSRLCVCSLTGALVEDTILCMHGGLSPDLKSLDQVQLLL